MGLSAIFTSPGVIMMCCRVSSASDYKQYCSCNYIARKCVVMEIACSNVARP